MSSLFNSASLRRLSGSPISQPPTALPDGDRKDASSSTGLASAPLPYQPRRRTPGGSTSSIPPPLALASDGAAPAAGAGRAQASSSSSSSSAVGQQQHTFPPPPGVQVTSPTSSTAAVATPTTNITRLFSHPVTPTTSTTDLSSSASLSASTETLHPAPTVSSSSLAAAEAPSGVNVSRASSLSNKDATGRLQLTNLKATAQRAIGLANDSLGMRMLEALVQDGSSTAEWRAVVELLLSKKVTLLLPAASAGTAEVTVEVVRDHLAFVELGEGLRSGSVCVLLKSGLVGRLGEDELAFESYLPPDSPALAGLLDPLTRKAALGATMLPPAPLPPASPSDSSSDPIRYPSVTPTRSSLLPFPPPSPPPPADASLSPQAASKSIRRASLLPAAPRNPFAGLFGRPRAASASPATPVPEASAPEAAEEKPAAETEKADAPPPPEPQPMEVELQPTPPDSRPLSVRSARSRSPSPARSTASATAAAIDAPIPTEEMPKDEKHAHLVSALGISVAIKPTDMLKALGKTWRARLADELVLDDHVLPSSVVKIVQRFACLPLPAAGQAKSLTAPPSAFKKASSTAAATASTATLSSLTGDPEVLAAGYQDFYSLVHEELEVAFRKEMVRALAAEEEGVREEKREAREREIEKRALEGVDVIEGCLARLHYNLMFSPQRSSDRQHDEVLASRIAALNMLGLTLDHLGVVTILPDGSRNEAVCTGLEALVKTVGNELQKISAPDNLSTQSKSHVLVAAHKLVIEGLRLLPPIRLRPEGEEMPASTPAMTEISTAASTPAESGQEEEEAQLPPSPPVPEQTSGQASDAVSIASDPLLVGGLEEAMSGSVLDLPSAPRAPEDDAVVRSPLDTPPDGEVTSPAAASTPVPTSAPQGSASSSGADLLLPLIIFAVVRSNPPQLVSHLLYIQRYRPTLCFSGEGSYALVNLTAVVDFLENVNSGSLGLAGEGKVLSADFQSFDEAVSKDLAALSTPQAQAAAQSRLRGRVTQVSDFASSGLNNVAATGLGALRSLIENGQMAAEGFMIQVPGVTSSNPTRPALLGRKTSGFSIANLATSVAGMAASAGGRAREGSISSLPGASPAIGSGPAAPGTAAGGGGGPGEWGVKREMVDVSSRPGSIFERGEVSDNDETDGPRRSDASDDGEDEIGAIRKDSDARSIRSTRSVGSTRSLGASLKAAEGPPLVSPSSERLSISERFARMSTGGSTGGDSPVGLGSSNSLPKATPFLPTHKTRSASNSVSSLTPSTRRATILGGATFIPPPSPTRPKSVISPPTTSPGTPPLTLPPLSQVHLPASSPLSSNPSAVDGADKPLSPQPTHIERAPGPEEDGSIRPPIARFIECANAGELKLAEVAGLLRDYQRLAGALRSIGVWDD